MGIEMAQRHIASDEFLVWAESLSGMLTSLRTTYGTTEELLEHADWDEGKTEYLLRLVHCLRADLTALSEEMKEHVKTKNHNNLQRPVGELHTEIPERTSWPG
jgi:hypothetical protein